MLNQRTKIKFTALLTTLRYHRDNHPYFCQKNSQVVDNQIV
jgi:hypothetical protein